MTASKPRTQPRRASCRALLGDFRNLLAIVLATFTSTRTVVALIPAEPLDIAASQDGVSRYVEEELEAIWRTSTA
eukprot:12994833-Heterocapsa_arctica.AAC.1